MKKIMNWAKKNKAFAVVVLLALVLFIFIVIIGVELLVGGSSNKYGGRLDGINKVKIAGDTYDGVKEEVKDTNLVEDVSVRLQGKIVYTTIVLKSDTSVEKAKEIAKNTLDNYDEKQLKFYDFSFFLKWKGEEKDKVITGNKHHNLDDITWIKS